MNRLERNRKEKFGDVPEREDFEDLLAKCKVCGLEKGLHSAKHLACPRNAKLTTGFKTQKEEEMDKCTGCRPARDTDSESGNGALPITNKQCQAMHAIGRKTGLIDGYNDRKYKKFLKDNYDAYSCKCLTIDEATDAMMKMVYDHAEREAQREDDAKANLKQLHRLLFG